MTTFPWRSVKTYAADASATFFRRNYICPTRRQSAPSVAVHCLRRPCVKAAFKVDRITRAARHRTIYNRMSPVVTDHTHAGSGDCSSLLGPGLMPQGLPALPSRVIGPQLSDLFGDVGGAISHVECTHVAIGSAARPMELSKANEDPTR